MSLVAELELKWCPRSCPTCCPGLPVLGVASDAVFPAILIFVLIFKVFEDSDYVSSNRMG